MSSRDELNALLGALEAPLPVPADADAKLFTYCNKHEGENWRRRLNQFDPAVNFENAMLRFVIAKNHLEQTILKMGGDLFPELSKPTVRGIKARLAEDTNGDQ